MLLSHEVDKNYALWSVFHPEQNRERAVDFVSRINRILDALLNAGSMNLFVDFIAWVGILIKRILTQLRRDFTIGPIFVGKPADREWLHELWDEPGFMEQSWICLHEQTEPGRD
jgi:hypothetical protein